MPPDTLALLVLGPAHGTQVFLNGRPDEYLVPAQAELARMVTYRSDPLVSEMNLRVHAYRRLCPLNYPRNKGAYVYEWSGER